MGTTLLLLALEDCTDTCTTGGLGRTCNVGVVGQKNDNDFWCVPVERATGASGTARLQTSAIMVVRVILLVVLGLMLEYKNSCSICSKDGNRVRRVAVRCIGSIDRDLRNDSSSSFYQSVVGGIRKEGIISSYRVMLEFDGARSYKGSTQTVDSCRQQSLRL